MEVASSDLPASSKVEGESESSMSNEQDHAVPPESGEDDSRSSSLSDIEDGLDNEQLDSISPELRKAPVEVDSEAETERIEESPNKTQKQSDIYLASGTQEKSPSKLMYSTNVGDIENDLDRAGNLGKTDVASNGNDLHTTVNVPLSPTKSSRLLSPPSDLTRKKRKRTSGDDSNSSSETEADEPLRKRTGSIRSDTNGNNVDEMDIEDDVDDETRPERTGDEEEQHVVVAREDGALTGDMDESDHKQVDPRSKKSKKGKRKGKRLLEIGEQSIRAQSEVIPEVSINSPAPTQGEEPDHLDEEEDDADDAEAAARNEEEREYSQENLSVTAGLDCVLSPDTVVKRMSAMDSLTAIEKQFATFKDRIYDDKLAQLNDELAHLQAPTSTHPEYLAMLKCIEQRRDEKIRLATVLFEYQVQALKVKSVAEKSQINSQFFQFNREHREAYMEKVGDEMYRIQRDRWGVEGNTPDYAVQFPTKRSAQILNQTAYNKEVSILSGIAKYVGFPAAPDVQGVNKSELDEDFEKMGIATQVRVPVQPPIQLVRGAFPSVSAVIPRASAEEQFLEQTPWANPQHPIHRQHLNRRISEQARLEDSFTTPGAQKRVVDFSAPNGSASTLPEVPSNQASSVAHTPADTEKPSIKGYQSVPMAASVSLEGTVESATADHMSESRSLPSSPTDHKKTQLPTTQKPIIATDTSITQLPRTSTFFNGSIIAHANSSPSTRGNLFSPPPKSEVVQSASTNKPDDLPEHRQVSPISAMKPLSGPGIAAGGGMNGIASR